MSVLGSTLRGVFLGRPHTRARRMAAPAVGPVPRVLLIDGDRAFSRALVGEAAASGVPVRSVSTHLALGAAASGPFDLILLDWETAGEEFAAEVAKEMGLRDERLPVLVIGDHGPQRFPQNSWPSNVLGYSDKRLGSEAILADALFVYANHRFGSAARKGVDQ